MKDVAHNRRGFTLAEIVVVLVMSSLVLAALLSGMIALVRSLQPRAVTIAGEVLPVAPTFGSFSSAVRLHQVFSDRVAGARAVYVFGGRHLSIPESATSVRTKPLSAQALPTISVFTAGLPAATASFHVAYAAALGAQMDSCHAEDFSVVVVGVTAGALAVTCLVQVRRTDVSVSDGATQTTFAVREVKLWQSTGDALRYVFAEPRPLTAGPFVGAVHSWFRFGSASGVAEEGPASVVFPDPWIHLGGRGRSDDVPAFSRFAYFLPISP